MTRRTGRPGGDPTDPAAEDPAPTCAVIPVGVRLHHSRLDGIDESPAQECDGSQRQGSMRPIRPRSRELRVTLTPLGGRATPRVVDASARHRLEAAKLRVAFVEDMTTAPPNTSKDGRDSPVEGHSAVPHRRTNVAADRTVTDYRRLRPAVVPVDDRVDAGELGSTPLSWMGSLAACATAGSSPSGSTKPRAGSGQQRTGRKAGRSGRRVPENLAHTFWALG
jgi:hypothetical protein